MGVNNIQFPVVDMFGAPSQEILQQGVEFIKENLTNGGVVYVHCKAGRSRSATLVGCYLMEVKLRHFVKLHFTNGMNFKFRKTNGTLMRLYRL